MPRIIHGAVVRLEELRAAIETVRSLDVNSPLPFNFVAHRPLTDFGYMFGGLQSDPGSLLPGGTDEEIGRTLDGLRRLGMTMRETGDAGDARDSSIPSAYTYFGQFVAHEITFVAMSRDIELDGPGLRPLTEGEVARDVKNVRTPTLDLDCVYGDPLSPVPRDDQNPELLKVGRVVETGFPPAIGGPSQDVPRKSYNPGDRRRERPARIGDSRNDENAITSQLHVAFLRAHNAIVAGGRTYNEARVILRQHFQWVVLDDFLNRVADPAVVREVLADPAPRYDPPATNLFLPLEFAVGAYRFGHSMVREAYEYNQTLRGPLAARLRQIFNPLDGWFTLPDLWVIGWDNFVNGGGNVARPIDTQLVEPLFALLNENKEPHEGTSARLAVRTLLMGYLLRLPTGQAVARELGLRPMTEAEVEGAAANQEQREVLRSTGFARDTPLWFYVLAEAAHERARREQRAEPGVDHLGPVGSRIVAEVLIGLVRRSEDSILRAEGWRPTLPKQGERFELSDILRLAGVLS